ncbi:hypothetical protein [Myxococcus fulvus]|uniref:hypothetical protein n=1 Tax=Myxococcus fulvus TaxID=33 RepID=UPI0020BD65A3|nr:hypothetical protein [Myxococcus fulvus]MCK8499676.1 hypothetical protein [Myxococcus fulvus]
MFVRRSWAMVLLLLLPGVTWAEDLTTSPDVPDGDASSLEPTSEAAAPEPGSVPPSVHGTEADSMWTRLLRMEVMSLTLLPRRGARGDEGFVQLRPTVRLAKRGTFRLNLGTPVRLRLWGGGADVGSVRKEDWDTLSDWGQVVHSLTLGGAPDFLWVGALESYTLLSGHLVRRYNNRGNPDYHPAGVVMTGKRGPLYAEAFASDVLGARLVGAEVSLDVQHILVGRPRQSARYMLALSAVRDWGRAGGTSKPLTLAHLDGTAILMRRRSQDHDFELHGVGGWGGRPGEGGAWGAVAGLGVEWVSSTMDLRARLEGRIQRGGFRQGAFGPDYELARFQVAGRSSVPLAEMPFPEGASAYGEVILRWDAERLGTLGNRHLRLTMGAEVFDWGRADVDGRLEMQLLHRDVAVAMSGLAVGFGEPRGRYLVSAEARWRFLGGKLYAVGQGGTLLFPAAQGALRPGAFAALGMGMDNVR